MYQICFPLDNRPTPGSIAASTIGIQSKIGCTCSSTMTSSTETPSSTDTLLGLVDLIYQSASDPHHWPRFLAALNKKLNTNSANVTIAWFSEDAPTQVAERRVVYSAGFPPEGLASYGQYFGALDPFLSEYKTRFPNGGTVAGEHLLDRNTFHRTAFYNEFAKLYDVEHVCFSRLEQHASTASGLGLTRPEKLGPFDDAALRFVAALVPHMRRAIQINRMLSQESTLYNHVTEDMNIAVVSLDAKGRPLVVSGLARDLFHRNDGLLLTGNHLAASNASQDAQLQQTIAAAIASSRGAKSHQEVLPESHAPSRSRPSRPIPYCGCLALSRSFSKHPLQVIVHPLYSSELLLENRPCAVVMIIDPDQKPTAPAAALQILYGLTPAESRLAELLLQGNELSTCAELLGNSIAGARVRLKSIMRKTNVSRQSELMRLFVGFPKTEALRRS